MSWDFERLKKEVYDILRRLELVELNGGSSSASDISVVPTGNLGSNNVQDALEELQADIDGLIVGAIPTYEYTFTSVTNQTFTNLDHGLSIITSVMVLDTLGKSVSVYYEISGTDITIDSNINLLNHKLILS